jgi:hypothetical protein
MARDLLGIPATSTPAERTFSRAGDIYTRHRKCLHGDAAQALLSLGSWWGIEGLQGVDIPRVKHADIGLVHKMNTCLPLVVDDGNGNFKISNEGVDESSFDKALEAVAADDGDDLEIVSADNDEAAESVAESEAESTADDDDVLEDTAEDVVIAS